MEASVQQIDVRKALNDPASVFSEPAEVIASAALSHRQKVAVLERWETEARSLAVAEEEGMTGGKDSMLARVRRAVVALQGDDAEEKLTPTTKAF